MQQKRMWITLTVGVFYAVAAMCIMIYALCHRGVVTEDAKKTQLLSGITEKSGKEEVNKGAAGREEDLMPGDEQARDKVIVIDPWCGVKTMDSRKGGIDEQEIALDIARRVEEKITSATSIKVYYAGNEKEMLSAEERVKIISEMEADFYVGIELNRSVDTYVYGIETVYNGIYFIPYFGNVELADCLERNVTEQVSGRANGLTQATEEDIILQKAKVPAVVLKPGYVSNNQEAALLNTEEYRDRIAEGVFRAVQEAYEKMENDAG